MRSRMRSNRAGDNAGIVVTRTESIGDKLADSSGILFLREKVSRDPMWPRDRKSAYILPIAVREHPAMKPYVVATSLSTDRERELMDIGREKAETVECSRRTMRYDALLPSTFPCWG